MLFKKKKKDLVRLHTYDIDSMREHLKTPKGKFSFLENLMTYQKYLPLVSNYKFEKSANEETGTVQITMSGENNGVLVELIARNFAYKKDSSKKGFSTFTIYIDGEIVNFEFVDECLEMIFTDSFLAQYCHLRDENNRDQREQNKKKYDEKKEWVLSSMRKFASFKATDIGCM